MNVTYPVPRLDAWITTTELKLDEELKYYFTSNYDQTTLFHGNIISFQFTLANYGHDAYECAQAVRRDLERKLSPYFRRCEVQVQTKPIKERGMNYALYIDITVADDNQGAISHRLDIKTDGNSLAKILHINNHQHEKDYEYKYRQERAHEY